MMASTAIQAQEGYSITFQLDQEMSKQLRQTHRTVPIWGDFTGNGHYDIYYSGTSWANGWTSGGWLLKNLGNGQFEMQTEKTYEEYEETIWQRDEDGNIKTDEDGNWLPELNEDGTIKTETRTRETGIMKNGLPYFAHGHGSVTFDYNQDGKLDILVSNAGGNDTGTKRAIVLIRNNGDGTFTKIEDEGLASLGYDGDGNLNEGQENYHIAVGDYNKDGYPDLLVEGWSDGLGRFVRLLRNKGEENGFEVVNNIFNPMPLENDIDIRGEYEYVSEYDEDGIEIGGAWDFEHPTKAIANMSHGPVAFIDLDGDGWLDLYVNGYRDGVDGAPEGKGRGGWWWHMYKNLGNGEFQDITHTLVINGEQATTCELLSQYGSENIISTPVDWNQDGKMDIYVAGDISGARRSILLLNVSDETGIKFQTVDLEQGIGDPGNRLFFMADFNGDDYPDIVTSGHSMFLGNWGVDYILSDASGTYHMEAHDESNPSANGLWRGSEQGTFGDFNGDGQFDYFVAAWCGAPWKTEEDGNHFDGDNAFMSFNTSDYQILAPEAPESVTAETVANGEATDIKVTWSAVSMMNLNQPMYNLYLQNTETGKVLMTVPANAETGKQLGYAAFAQYILGNDEGNTYTFPNVPKGKYKVGVQAVSYAYQASAFTTTIDDIDTAVKGVASTGTAMPSAVQVFTIDGRRTNGHGHGIFVVKQADGTVKKVIK
ncbi:MAG: VCBS repeat-containing protein [Bacteroidaceae bacterium]|nr:VCBS repeat-containing protein [Bacteroidaceae bacterium]